MIDFGAKFIVNINIENLISVLEKGDGLFSH